MVTSNHEAAHRLFQERPELIPPIFRILGLPPPDKANFEVLPTDLTEIRPLQLYVDSLLRVEPSNGDHFLLAVEAQTKRSDAKETNWAYYLSFVKEKYKLPAVLLAICGDRATARWAAGPLRLGPKWWTSLSVHPVVLGPENVPAITDPEAAAQDLVLASFSAITHSGDQDASVTLDALAQALGTADPDSVAYFAEFVEVGLGETPAQETWRNLMSIRTAFPGRGTLIEETLLAGEAKGQAHSVLCVLEARSIPVWGRDARAHHPMRRPGQPGSLAGPCPGRHVGR